MTKNCCVVICTSLADIDEAISKLEAAQCKLDALSVISHENLQGLHWNTGCQSQSFVVTGLGCLWVVGQMASVMAQTADNIEVGDKSDVLAAALFKMGVPRASINEYEQALEAQHCLLIFYAVQKDIEQVCEVLHSETQQVIVHHS